HPSRPKQSELFCDDRRFCCLSRRSTYRGGADARRQSPAQALRSDAGYRGLRPLRIADRRVDQLSGGLILAFVGAVQLRQFGAAIFVANLVGIAMVREMGAIMTAILMSGRTGAAFAANLGTMQVSDEVSALQTLGIPSMEFLVLPRILALSLMMPLLTVFANIVGMLGGLLIGTLMLDISPIAYYNQTSGAVGINDWAVGLVKAVLFGAVVAIVGCWRGMRCRRSGHLCRRSVHRVDHRHRCDRDRYLHDAKDMNAMAAAGTSVLSDPRSNAAREPHIVVEDQTMAYGDFVIQHDLNFTMNKGDIFIIMGGSGCGKKHVAAPSRRVAGARVRTSTVLRRKPVGGRAREARCHPAKDGGDLSGWRVVELDDAGRERCAAARAVYRSEAGRNRRPRILESSPGRARRLRGLFPHRD